MPSLLAIKIKWVYINHICPGHDCVLECKSQPSLFYEVKFVFVSLPRVLSGIIKKKTKLVSQVVATLSRIQCRVKFRVQCRVQKRVQCRVQDSTVQFSTVQYRTVQCGVVQCSTGQYSAV